MEFLSYLISGISLGSIYAIIALGYTMVYGIAKMLNFAHGDIIMIGGYVSFCSMYYLNLPPIVATLLAVIACTVLGIVIERLAYAPLRSAPSLAVLITAIGVSYFLQNSALLIWKAAAKTYPPVVDRRCAAFQRPAHHFLHLSADHRRLHRHHAGADHLRQQVQDGQGHAGLL